MKNSYPKTPEEIHEWLSSNYRSFRQAEDRQDDEYFLTAHDLLSAFSEWAGNHKCFGDMQEIRESSFNLGWSLALNQASFYVWNHLIDGDDHVDIILSLRRPDFKPAENTRDPESYVFIRADSVAQIDFANAREFLESWGCMVGDIPEIINMAEKYYAAMQRF